MPERIQMSRQHPWRAEHPDAVIVDRRTRWGNPFRVVRCRRGWWVSLNGWDYGQYRHKPDAVAEAVRQFRQVVERGRAVLAAEIRAELAGRDLACWCAVDEPCHADVLLDIANGSQP